MPQGRVPDRQKSVVCSLLRVPQRRSKIFYSVLHAKGRRPCQKARKPHLTHCCSIYYIRIYQIFSLLLRHEKGLRHGIEKGHRGGPGGNSPEDASCSFGKWGSPRISRGASSGLRSASGRVFFLTPGAPSSLTNPSASCLFKQYRQECKS